VGWAGVALADPLPVGNNLNFSSLANNNLKENFTQANPAGWTGGNGLIFIASPTNPATTGPNATWGNPSGNIPGNYVQADGNPIFESGFQRQITGLTVGKSYTLSFFQGASQQAGFTGATTNQWAVGLGTSGLFSAAASTPSVPQANCGTHCVVSSADPTASIVFSTLMHVPSEGVVGWEFTQVTLTADATTDLLSFLAWGDNGNTTNLPPMAFLSGIDAPASTLVTEPSTLAVYGVGLLGLGAGVVRRRRKASNA
jgi:MYXO-CTERM domain-containing protein